MPSTEAQTQPSLPDHSSAFRAVAALSALLFVSRLIPFLVPQARLWGFNHLIFLPAAFWIVYIGLGFVLTITVIPAVREYLARRFSDAGEYLFGERLLLKWCIIAAVSLPIFWFFRMPTTMLGDGYTVINNIAGSQPTIFKWSETGAVAVVYFVSRILSVEGLARGEYAYAIVSVISGAVSVVFFFGLAREIGKDGASRLFCAGLLLLAGWSLLFFGYAENYPILWPMITGYLYFGARYLRGRGAIALPLAFAVVAAALHLQMLFYLPSLAALLLGRGVGSRVYSRHTKTVWAILGVIAIAAVATFIWRYHQSISFAVHFLPILHGRPATPDYAIVSLNHLLDMANELLLLIPLLPVLIVLGWDGLKKITHDVIAVFLLVFASGGVILLLILDPRIGMGRDWDLFAAAGLGVMILLLRATMRGDNRFTRLCPSLILLAAILVYPFFAVNLTAEPSLNYMKWLLDLDRNKSTSGMAALRDYYRNTGDIASADSLELILRERREIIKYADRAMAHAEAGRYRQAMAVVDTVFQLDPYSRESFNLRGTVYSLTGRYERAIADFETSLEMEPYDFRVLVNLARAYYRAGRYEPMMKYLRRAEELNPTSGFVLQAMAMGYIARERYDSAYIYGRRLLVVDSTEANGYLAVGLFYYGAEAYDSAEVYLERYVDLIGPGPDRDRAARLLDAIEQQRQDD